MVSKVLHMMNTKSSKTSRMPSAIGVVNHSLQVVLEKRRRCLFNPRAPGICLALFGWFFTASIGSRSNEDIAFSVCEALIYV